MAEYPYRTGKLIGKNGMIMKKQILPVLFLLLLGTVTAQNQRADIKWTPEFSMKFRSVSDLALAPDGRHVAYVVRTPVMEGEESEYRQQIWVAAVDGSQDVQYTRAEKSSRAPAFSPDGQYLAFLSERSGKSQIWLMRLMGGEPEQLTDTEKGVSSFAWSPDGNRLAFTMADADTEEEKKQKKEKRDVILVDQQFKYTHLYTVPMDKDEEGKRPLQRLTNGDFHVMNFDWSPDGQTIVFSHKPDPAINTSRLFGDISLVPADSGAVSPLVTGPGVEDDPHFSPDGSFVAFTSTGSQPEPVGLRDIFTVPANGGRPVAQLQTPDRNASLLGWSKDGSRLLAQEAFHTSRMVMSLPFDPSGKAAGKVRMLTGEGAAVGSAVVDTRNNVMAYVYETTDRPAEVMVATADGTNPRAISRVNAEIALPAMGKTELLRWQSKDGMEIEGLLTYPAGYEAGKSYPLILQIHGGPAGVFTQTFTGGPSIYLTQYFANQGFFVLRPNPRGSTGYGKDFRYANVRDWGYGDYEDVMSGVDKAIAMAGADPDQLYVMGWSYGGYLTSFLVTRTSRFRAASMGAGLPNLVSMVTTTDIPDYLVGHFVDEFWEDYDTYEKHSAIYRIKNVETPTQIIHGANDLRVPTTQGQEFYVALKRRGVPTEMILLPRTPHGPREPKLLMEVSPRIMGWFDKFREDKARP